MKEVIALLGFLTLAAMGYAQAPKHLQGPRAKNYKPWLKPKQQVGTIAHIQVNPKKPKGPAAKHRKARMPDSSTRYTATEVKKYKRLTGPRYKNLRPWQKAPEPKILVVKAEQAKQKAVKKPKQVIAP